MMIAANASSYNPMGLPGPCAAEKVKESIFGLGTPGVLLQDHRPSSNNNKCCRSDAMKLAEP